ncbi:hypothetical protein E4U14_002244 [Claviceps sp. LM454 group G7]|nr:hypothetical protein E4U14_002244 [Claviceps sp. LM454 group G7]
MVHGGLYEPNHAIRYLRTQPGTDYNLSRLRNIQDFSPTIWNGVEKHLPCKDRGQWAIMASRVDVVENVLTEVVNTVEGLRSDISSLLIIVQCASEGKLENLDTKIQHLDANIQRLEAKVNLVVNKLDGFANIPTTRSTEMGSSPSAAARVDAVGKSIIARLDNKFEYNVGIVRPSIATL